MPQRYDLTEESSMYDLLLYALDIDEDEKLTPEQRVALLAEITDLDRVTANFVKSRDRIAAERTLEQFKAERKAAGDQLQFERDLIKLQQQTGAERVKQADQLIADLATRVDQINSKVQPQESRIDKALLGAQTIPEQIKRMTGDALLGQFQGLSGDDARVYANLKRFGERERLFELRGAEIIPADRLKSQNLLPTGTYRQLVNLVKRTYPEWLETTQRSDRARKIQSDLQKIKDNPTLQFTEKDVETIIGITRDTADAPELVEKQAAADIQEITEALAEDDAQLKAFEEDRARLIKELNRAPEDKVKTAYAKAVANPNFRLWAESNGFNIGTSDGTVDTYEPGSDDNRAILTYGLQAKSGMRFAPREGRTVKYGDPKDVYIEERLTAYDIERGKRRLFDPDKQETIEIPLDEPIEVMEPIRIPAGQRIQMKRNQMVDARREKRARKEFLGDDDMSAAEKRLMGQQLKTEEDIEARQARVGRLLDPIGEDALVVAGDNGEFYFRDKDGNLKGVDAQGLLIDFPADAVEDFEYVEQNRDMPEVQELIRKPQDVRAVLKDSPDLRREETALGREQQRATDIVEERAAMRGKFLPTPETTLPTSEEREKLERDVYRLDREVERTEELMESEFVSERQKKGYATRLERLKAKRDQAQARLGATETLPDMPQTPKPVEVGESIPRVLPAIPFSEPGYDYVYDPNSREFRYKSPDDGEIVVVTPKSDLVAFKALIELLKKQKPDARLGPGGASTAEATEGTVIEAEKLLDEKTPVAGLGAAMEAGRQAQDAGVGISDTVLKTARDLGEAGRTGTPLPGGSYYDRLMQVQRQLKGAERKADRAQRRAKSAPLTMAKYALQRGQALRATSREGNEPSARAERLRSRRDKTASALREREQTAANLLDQVERLRLRRDELEERVMNPPDEVKLRKKKETPRPPPGKMTPVSEGIDVEEKGVSNGAQ